MGKGMEVTCSQCGYEMIIRFGVGMMYGGLDDLSSTGINILHLIDSKRIQSYVKTLIKHKNGTINVVKDSYHTLYKCPECEVPYNLFWFKLKHVGGVYEPDYLCAHCETELLHISNASKALNDVRCPKCWNKTTFSTNTLTLIYWD